VQAKGVFGYGFDLVQFCQQYNNTSKISVQLWFDLGYFCKMCGATQTNVVFGMGVALSHYMACN
jgi:tetrahydromethanopterin S-methyltransferase subunit E